MLSFTISSVSGVHSRARGFLLISARACLVSRKHKHPAKAPHWHRKASDTVKAAVPAFGEGNHNPNDISKEAWDTQTVRLAHGATAAFLVLLLPQIIRNARNIMAGNYSVLAAIAWVVSFVSTQSRGEDP